MSATLAAKRVLVVDDDSSFVTFVCTAIERLGCRADVAPTGSDALNRLAEGRWCGVFLDLNLPDIQGLEVLRSLRVRGDLVPVVIVTGAGSIPAAIEATRLGAIDFLEKPIRLPALARSMERLIAPAYDAEAAGPRRYIWHATELVAGDLVAVVSAPADSPTVAHWAALLGVSTAVVSARCDRARLSAKACLDLGRIVRASVVRGGSDLPLTEILACRDQRTIAALLIRGGFAESDFSNLEVGQVLMRQSLVRHKPFIKTFSRNLEQILGRKLQ